MNPIYDFSAKRTRNTSCFQHIQRSESDRTRLENRHQFVYIIQKKQSMNQRLRLSFVNDSKAEIISQDLIERAPDVGIVVIFWKRMRPFF